MGNTAFVVLELLFMNVICALLNSLAILSVNLTKFFDFKYKSHLLSLAVDGSHN